MSLPGVKQCQCCRGPKPYDKIQPCESCRDAKCEKRAGNWFKGTACPSRRRQVKKRSA